MKKVIVYLLILIPLISFSQNWQIPEIDWEGKTETENNYVELLKLKDRNSLIVKIGYSSYWTKGQNSEFIVYQNGGKVKRFIVYQPNSTEFKTKVKRKRIKKKHYEYYWNYLRQCITGNKLKIDKSKLNITEKKGKEEGTVQSMSISDGANYHFQICQGKNYIAYGSYEPKVYIENEYPGSEERQKLVDLMNGFERLTEKY
ncbi:hypothetical protein FPF71_17770 [Algibacter amylolyticus]|uniref:Uncharacterized protein n=1 Tax=Algibacter amylolyticus TaxID=1608400 RepID=A0A5M7AYU5_9FLAO|nr:hypothetical protein [Algibacter amylolyticus]KAA5820414.1 hypothetical protein F2B50_17770 [Algibacter amylolyticus]MBB5269993.1 hypothetical protein [Algibacter amylolyticus]TSJ70487.1 hypothetical protein FPF71_17770 [Algibacter amylolyticus]